MFSWPALVSAAFIVGTLAVSLLGEATVDYVIGQRVEQPIYAKVDFQVPNPKETQANREAAQRAVPSYYKVNTVALTFDRIRADLMRFYQAAVDAETFESFEAAMEEAGWPAERNGYNRLRRLAEMSDDAGRAMFQEWVGKLPLESQYVVRGLSQEPRTPPSLDFIRLETPGVEGEPVVTEIPHAELVQQGNDKALQGIASYVARRLPAYELTSGVEAIVLAAFREQPTILFDNDRTRAAMRQAEEATPEAMATHERSKPFITPGMIGSQEYELLEAHHAAYNDYLALDTPKAVELRLERFLQRAGLVALVALLGVGLLAYTRIYQPRIFLSRARVVAFTCLLVGALLAARLLDMKWPLYPELVFVPCLMAASVLAIAYSRRFAMGAACIVALLAATMARADLTFLLTLLTGVVLAVYQLDEIRSRTKLIQTGAITAFAVVIASAAGGVLERQPLNLVIEHTLLAGLCAWLASFVVSGLLPFIERLFRTATSLTLLEWRDPTRPLLQLLASEAPGTYTHSLQLGTLVEAACKSIGANGLLAQVGALYHDVGKIHRPPYFTENQEGRISRHENLSPTMSLLIILGHVKDGLELARQYRLPPVLHEFIAEHHGTTVVRYFHRAASDKQPLIASGKHDREVPEADFRYGGPKPHSRESAILMLSDGVEGAVRALSEPTVGRIEGAVHSIVAERLNDGQFDECDITLREIREVEQSLVKSLCSIYHGRVAYPKAPKADEGRREPARLSV